MFNHFDEKIQFRRTVEQVWNQHSAKIQHLCERKCSNAEDARDLFQTVALKFCENLDRLLNRQDVMPWLLTVMHHSFLDAVEEQKRVCLMSAVQEPTPEYMGFREEDSAFYSRMAAPDIRIFIAKAFEILNPLERMLLDLKYFGGFSIREISGVLGLSENAVRKRRAQAFAKIRRFYEENSLVSKLAE